MKTFSPLFLLLTLFLSSCDRRLSIATTFIEDSVEQQNIDVLSTDFSSIAIPMHYSKTLKELLDFSQLKEEYETALSDYKQKHFAGQNRAWMKTMTGEQLTTYKKLKEQHRELESKSLWSIFYHALPDKEKRTSVWIKYKKEKSETIKYGVFFFNEKGEIKNHMIFNEDTYYAIKELVDTYKKLGVAPQYTAPNFDSVGLDIVPVDEDPTKTKAERAAIKMKEKQEKEEREAREKQRKEAQERADMMRTNPILRTFFGVTLGYKSASRIVNHLRNQGFKIEEFAEEYDGNFNGYIDVAYWDEVRIFVRYPDGKFTGIQFTTDLRNPYSRKRDYSRDVEEYYNRIISDYRGKYSFWSTSHDGSEYEDEKTKLKVKYWNSRVWVTYSLKGYTTPGV